MRKKILVASVLASSFALVVACVGDDPETVTGTTNDGGADGSLADGSTSDGGIQDGASTNDRSPSDDDGGLASISGLSLWLEADDLAPGLFSTWLDRSGKGNNALAATTTQPFVDVPNNGINGHLVVAFDGGSPVLTIHDQPSLQFDASGFLIEIVERHPAFAAGGIVTVLPYSIFQKAPTTVPQAGPTIFVQYAISPAPEHPPFVGVMTSVDASIPVISGAGVTTAADTPHRLRVRLKNTSGTACVLSLQVDSDPEQTLNVLAGDDLRAAGLDVLLGKSLRGDIAAIIAVKAPTDADVARVDAYLKTRYGI